MILNLGSALFNTETLSGGGTPSWGTEMGQGEGYRFNFEDYQNLITALVYKSIPAPQTRVHCPLGKGGNKSQDYEFVVASLFDKVFVNEMYVDGAQFLLLVVKKLVGSNHIGRRTLKYNPHMTIDGVNFNEHCLNLVANTLGVSPSGSWFISEINVRNQDELHFTAHILDKDSIYSFADSSDRSATLASKIKAYAESHNKNYLARFADIAGGTLQKIYYGCPGSGKSHKVKDITNTVNPDYVFRTTFHPDSDYASFVGCYKPSMNGGDIEYTYSTQVFTNAYVQAWKNPETNVYLIIEEINRGNCAQIFGDLFQLLDRDKVTGKSEYPIKADKDLVAYIEKALGAGHDGIKNGELCLPSNLIIYATMNTSDQSLFPMDSAFKRRWDWEYVPINYSKDIDSGKFIIKLDDGTEYLWIEFLEKVNEKISDATSSEDKQMGNFFIKKSVDAKEFVNKVMFYLWNEVCKEEYGTQRNFFRKGKDGKTEFKFTELFGKNQTTILNEFMTSLGVEPTNKPKPEEPAAE